MVERVAKELKLDMLVVIAFSFFYAGKVKEEKELKSILLQFLNHDTVPEEVTDFALDYLTRRCLLEFDRNPHNGNLILRVKYCKKV
jgi:hypothetical protein